jgi:hypothetical protein
MPHVLDVAHDLDRLKMPKMCPYCLANDISSSIEVKYMKTLGMLSPAVVLFVYQDNRFRFPACGRCAKTVNILGKLAPLIALIPLIALLAGVYLQWPHPELLLKTAIGGAVLGGVLISYRQWIVLKFRVGYQNHESTLLYARSRHYAEELGRINNLTPQYRLLVLRWW